ncbi:MAG: translational GTPase TypA, partial [Megasphaera micronuciformis]|nr:translational GTPase TypA [Megasphaera micronuciformis]
DEVLELFMELDANDEQLDFPVIYANGRDGIAKTDMADEGTDLQPLFKAIIDHCPCPKGDLEGPLQFMVTTLDYDDYVGKIAIGRIVRGSMKPNQNVLLVDGESQRKAKISRVYTYEGLNRVEREDGASMGDIACIVGIPDIKIGETVADPTNPEALPKIDIDEPTLSMIFYVNDSPFAGQEGDFVTSRHLRDRLFREVQTNVSLRVEETGSADAFKVSGRGELHIAVLIEEMRRQGYEMQIGKPSVITKEINGQKCEPLEALTIDVPQEFMGAVMERLGTRKAEMVNMVDIAGYTRLEFIIPARGLIGFRSEFLTATKGNGIMYHVFHGYAPWKGDIPGRTRGSLVAFEAGETTAYGIYNLQDRGTMFISPAQEIYLGQVIGESNRDVDIDVNPCKKKHLSNTRSSASDEALRLVPPRIMSLEQALEWINDDELVEVTPKSIRLRKAILDKHDRKKAA